MRVNELVKIGEKTVEETITHPAEYDESGELVREAWEETVEKKVPVMDTVYRDATPEEIAEMERAHAEMPEPETKVEPDTNTYSFCIELPEETLPDAARVNLDRIIESKGNLLRKALGTDTLSYEVTDGKVRFPWFHISGSPEEVTAYTQLITALAEMAKNSMRITAKERPVDNEKYAFRCFLLRLGFIGDAYKASRKILLKNMDGNSAFRDKK